MDKRHKSMRKNISYAAAAAALLIMAVVFLYTRPHKLSGTLDAFIYENGEISGETSVTFDGKLKRELFSSCEQSYVGSFKIDCLEKSCREGAEAEISWCSHDCQLMNWYYMGDFYTSESFLDISKIEIDEQMKDIRVFLSDGRLIHASALTENISTNSGV